MEKTLFNQVGEVKGASSESEDSYSFQFTPQNENLKRTRGALFSLITVSGKTNDRYEKAKSLYHQFQSSYYAKASGSILHGLSDTIEHLAKTSLKREEETGLKISIIAAVFWGSVVYLSKHGEGAVFVARNGKIKQLEFAKVASGVLEDQDTVCLASGSFAEKVSVEDLGEALTKEKFEESLKILDERIEKIEAAVCDVIRLSVNAPKEEPQAVTIAEIDETGEAEESTTSEKEGSSEEPVSEEEVDQVEAEEVPTTAVEGLDDPFDQPRPKEGEKVKVVLASIKLKAASLGAKLLKPWKKPVPGELYDPVAVRRARIAQIVVVLVSVLLISVMVGVLSRGTEKKDTQIAEMLTTIEQDLAEANNIKAIDPSRALALVDQAEKDLKEAKKIDPENTEIAKLEDQSNDLQAEITKTTKIDNLETLADLSKISKEIRLDDSALFGNQMILLDRNLGSIYSLDVLDGKEAVKVESTFTSPETTTSYPAGFYLSGQSGIGRLDSSLKLTSVGTNANWGKIVSSATHLNNLYLLDPSKNEIWLYRSTSAGLSAGKAYLVGEKPDLSTATTISIDDVVWVGTKSGTIYKFSSGKQQSNFAISGMADPIGELVDIFTSSASKNHYLLDKGKGRVVAIDKTGNYLASYFHEQLHKATTLIINEEAEVAYFSAENKVYQFKLP